MVTFGLAAASPGAPVVGHGPRDPLTTFPALAAPINVCNHAELSALSVVTRVKL